MIKKVMVISLLGLALASCQDDAKIANKNLTKAADNFELMRSITFYNTWQDVAVLQITGVCSVNDRGNTFTVTCKEPDGTYTRRHMGRNQNMTYYLDQIDGANISVYHSRVTFKPQSLIPDIDFRGDAEELTTRRDTSDSPNRPWESPGLTGTATPNPTLTSERK